MREVGAGVLTVAMTGGTCVVGKAAKTGSLATPFRLAQLALSIFCTEERAVAAAGGHRQDVGDGKAERCTESQPVCASSMIPRRRFPLDLE